MILQGITSHLLERLLQLSSIGPELSSGTACGVDALPNGKSTSGEQGGGPGYLYVCQIQLHSNIRPLLIHILNTRQQ
jgi:hypothetical protein